MTMKQYLAAVLLLAPVLAFADPRIDSMVGQCRCVMMGGICAEENRAPSKAPVKIAGYGTISAAENGASSGSGMEDASYRDRTRSVTRALTARPTSRGAGGPRRTPG